MRAFHQGLATGQPADLALRQAMLDQAEKDPIYCWAPYKLVCLGAASDPSRLVPAAEPAIIQANDRESP